MVFPALHHTQTAMVSPAVLLAHAQVKAMGKLFSKFLQIYLVVSPSFSSVNLHSESSTLHLPVSSVLEECKATKARAVHQVWQEVEASGSHDGSRKVQEKSGGLQGGLSRHQEVEQVQCQRQERTHGSERQHKKTAM